MKFIEMSGEQLESVINDGELHSADLGAAGVTPNSIVRVNQQGDIEVRLPHKWSVIGGLLGSFEERVRETTSLDWV
jgi:hypothetical protein